MKAAGSNGYAEWLGLIAKRLRHEDPLRSLNGSLSVGVISSVIWTNRSESSPIPSRMAT